MNLKETLLSILNLGINRDTEPYPAFLIFALNCFALFGLACCIFSVIIMPSKNMQFYIVIVGVMIAFGSIIIFNAFERYGLAKFSIFGFYPLVQFINLLDLDDIDSGVILTLVPFVFVTPFVIQSKLWKLLTFIYLSFIIIFPCRHMLKELQLPMVFNVVITLGGMVMGFYLILSHFKKSAEKYQEQNVKLKFQNSRLETLIDQNKLKTELLGILSHDLKGPANSFNELSKKVAFLIKHERFEDLQKFGDYFESAGDKIFHDINRLLNWTISQKEYISVDSRNVFPFRLINSIKKKFALQNSYGIFELNNSIPQNLFIKSDAQIFEIILQNLLSNAVKNSIGNENINVHAEYTNDNFVLSINNNESIDMKLVELAKVGKYQKPKNGTGLGLGICFSLVKLLDGELVYETDENIGTTVKIILPLKKPKESENIFVHVA